MDSDVLRGWMDNFEKTGKLTATPELLARAQAEMKSAAVSQPEVSAQIKEVHRGYAGYTLDPHSSIGVAAAAKVSATSPVVCLACAHWAKFPDAVGKAIGEKELGAMAYPEELEAVKKMAGRKEVMENDSRVIRQYIRSTVYGPAGKKSGGCPFAFVTQPTFIAAVAVVAIGAVYFLRK